jgi:CubicO group peptidase (beta-lactamase class C family)
VFALRFGMVALFLLCSILLAAPNPKTADAYLRAKQFNGAVLLVKNNKVVLRQGYGLSNLELKTPFLTSTRFQVASISKMFTALTALRLVKLGKWQLEDLICRYLKPCPKPWKAIRLKHLIHHTSGIADYETPLGLYSQKYLDLMTRTNATQEILEQAAKAKLEFVPGSRFSYSNTAYIVLSFLIERVNKKPFNQTVQELVIAPAKLQYTAMLEPNQRPGIALGYSKNWLVVPPLALSSPAGDAALVSTVDDLHQWSQYLETIPEAKEVFTSKLGGYGYGWFIDSRFAVLRYVHTGELPGYRTVFIKFPTARATMILFSNQDQTPMEIIARDLSKLLLEK